MERNYLIEMNEKLMKEMKKEAETTRKEINKKTQTPISKAEADTFVCDGAKLTCPNMVVVVSSGANENLASCESGLELLVLDAKGYFMGVDPMGTEKELSPLNFTSSGICKKLSVAKMELEMKNGKKSGFELSKCAIQPAKWEKLSERILKNGARVLTKDSILRCNVDLGVEISITDNGQDISGFGPEITSWLKSMNATPENQWILELSLGGLDVINGRSDILEGLGVIVETGNLHIGGSKIATGVASIGFGARDMMNGIYSGLRGEKRDLEEDAVRKMFSIIGFSQADSNNVGRKVKETKDALADANSDFGLLLDLGLGVRGRKIKKLLNSDSEVRKAASKAAGYERLGGSPYSNSNLQAANAVYKDGTLGKSGLETVKDKAVSTGEKGFMEYLNNEEDFYRYASRYENPYISNEME